MERNQHHRLTTPRCGLSVITALYACIFSLQTALLYRIASCQTARTISDWSTLNHWYLDRYKAKQVQ